MSFWDLDEPPVSLARRTTRAALVGAAWIAAAVPLLLGWRRCAVATLFHRPCPGCGMTRAIVLLFSGQARASLRMHPLAVPVLAIGASCVVVTVATTLRLGSPFRAYGTPLGRGLIAAAVVVYAAALVLWTLRWFGLFGGPVAV